MTLSRRRAPLTLLLIGVALLAALLLIPWAVHAQSNSTAPTNLTAEVVDGGIALSWDAPTEDADSVTGYEVLRRRPRQGENSLSTYVADTGSATTTYTDTNATEPGERYVYRVKALRVGEKSGRSNYVRVDLPESEPEPASTPEPTPAPTPEPTPEPTPQTSTPDSPTGLTDASVAHDRVALSWDDPQDDSISGYQVLRRSRDGEVYGDGQGAAAFVAVIDDTGSPAAAYTDTSVTARTRYVYRVKAINAAGLSERSSYLNVETSAEPAATQQTAPAKPAGLEVSAFRDNSVTIRWDDPGDSSITHYQVLRREGDLGPFTTTAEDTGSAETAYTDTTVSADTAYEYRVIAVNAAGASPESDSLSAQTLPAPIVAPPELEPEEPLVSAQQQEAVDIPDANLRAAVEAALGKSSGQSISVAEMATLTDLSARNQGITSLAGLEHATGLTHVDLFGNSISGALDLDNWRNLQHLVLDYNEITELTNRRNLSQLRGLYVSNNDLTTLRVPGNTLAVHARRNRISSFGSDNASNVRSIDLSGNRLSGEINLNSYNSLGSLLVGNNNITHLYVDFSSQLVTLSAPNNRIFVLNLRGDLPALKYLNMSNNPETLAGVVAEVNAPNLEHLNMANNGPSDKHNRFELDFRKFPNLTYLNVSQRTAHGSVRKRCLPGVYRGSKINVGGLSSLTTLKAAFNNFTEIKGVGDVTGVTLLELGVNCLANLNLSGFTEISSLSLNDNLFETVGSSETYSGSGLNLYNIPSLSYLNLNGNRINAGNLSGLPALAYLSLAHNEISGGVTSGIPNTSTEVTFSNLPALVSLDLSYNRQTFTPGILNFATGLPALRRVIVRTSQHDLCDLLGTSFLNEVVACISGGP